MRIALDAMGGDFAPAEVVKGAILAAQELKLQILLVGDEEKIRKEMGSSKSGIEIVHASQVIEMSEHPAAAVRRKRDASMVVAAKLVAEGKADAMISAGNSGAAMAVATMKVGRIPGIERPAIASLFPAKQGATVLLDAGANVDCSPDNLVDFATMGSIYAEQVLDIKKPRVGLLNIGEESTKGNELTRATHELLKMTPLNFVGNIEGRQIFSNTTDVIVCDGFIGNVVLKVGEGLGEYLVNSIKEEIKSSWVHKIAALVLASGLRRIQKRFDYTEYGGAPLLGVKGVCIISHGRSNARAIFAAVRAAKRAVEGDVVGKIQNALENNRQKTDTETQSDNCPKG